MDKIEAYFNYRNPLKEGELKPAFGLQEEDPLMPNHSSHKKTIQNARLKNFKIEMGGFELLSHKSSVKDFFDDNEVSQIYYPEMTKLVKDKKTKESFDESQNLYGIMPKFLKENGLLSYRAVSYTHLTLPTNREV